MELTKHSVWDVQNIEEYQTSLLEPVFIKPEVPESIKRDLEIIEKLMLHTYFEYDFIDIALLHSVIALEKALRIRYEELGHKQAGKNFQKLIEWFYKSGYFETDSLSEIHSLRDIRNKKVHDVERQDKGLLYIKTVYTVFDLINDLYEDCELRKKRKEGILDIQMKLGEIYKNGCIFQIKNQRWIVFQVIPVFLNNKGKQEELTLNLWQIFNPNSISFERGMASNCITVTALNWVIGPNGFRGQNKDDNTDLFITPISDAVNAKKYHEWFSVYRKKDSWMLNWFQMTDKIGFTKILRQFYINN